VHGDGRQTRDFTYVADVVSGVLAACETPGVSGEIINIAAGARVSLLEVIQTLQRLLKTSVAPTFGPTREGDIRDSQADIFKARKLLQFEPRWTFEDGLRETVAWFQHASEAEARHP
jgi:nucleoside-diphosphate-sugar epimerase